MVGRGLEGVRGGKSSSEASEGMDLSIPGGGGSSKGSCMWTGLDKRGRSTEA